MPDGSPVQRLTKFTLFTDNGTRTEIYYTDSNGRIALPRAISVPYTIVVETDGETYDTTTVSFNPVHAGNYIVVNLRPFTPKASRPSAVVRVNELDPNVSTKAREAYEEAIKMLQAEKYDQARELLKRAISLQPDYVQAHNNLGALYLKLNQLDKAEETLKKAVEINSKWYLPQLNLGLLLNRQGKFKEAAELLTRLQKNNPSEAKIHAPLIEALIEARSWESAEAEIIRALEIKEADQVDLKVKLGMVRIKQGKFQDALAPLGDATLAEPDNALAQFNLGVALEQTGNLDKAETALKRAYQIGGAKMAGAQLVLGVLYHKKGAYLKAIEAFETYLKDLPEAPNAARVKESIQQLRQVLNKK